MGAITVIHHHLQLQGVEIQTFDMGSARRIMQLTVEGMLWMGAGSSWRAQGKVQRERLHVLLAVATGTSIRGKCKVQTEV